ncbi:hypothetical protein N6H14_13890 [Paenibacillus sp. CC-CFT747]|nr:hypothetical protein N6H14_13890 [Paenibacillus sp. CC-CFT747]
MPHDPEVAAAAKEWKAVIDSHGMGDKTFLRSVESYYREAPDAALVFGMDEELYAYIREAVACLNE